MDLQHTRKSGRNPSETVDLLEKLLSERKMSVLFRLDMKQKLAEKGMNLEREIHILEVCNASIAQKGLEANPDIAIFMPCKVIVREEPEGSLVLLPRPTALVSILGDANLGPLAHDIEGVLIEAIDQIS